MKSLRQAMTSSIARHDWLEKATAALRVRFTRLGYTVPAEVRVSIGWPKGSRGGNGGHTIGQCWSPAASTDKHHEIFISPELYSGARIIDVLAHELVHAVVGNEAGHKAPFKACAEKVGLTGKMTATTATPELNAWARDLMVKIGQYPAGGLRGAEIRKKQSTRMLKCECGVCGYTVRTTAKWVAVGLPICPTDEIEMTCDSPEGEE